MEEGNTSLTAAALMRHTLLGEWWLHGKNLVP